jgi:hypothetical protein
MYIVQCTYCTSAEDFQIKTTFKKTVNLRHKNTGKAFLKRNKVTEQGQIKEN